MKCSLSLAAVAGGCILYSLTSCNLVPPNSARTAAVAVEIVNSYSGLDATIASRVAAGRYPGAVYLISKGDRVIHQGAVGLADTDKNAPIGMDSIFRLMSMTKPVTAVAAMILVDDRKIALDDQLGHYLSEFAGSAITIRQLLTHTSGIGFGSIAVPGENLADRVRKIASKPLPTPAGTKWQYSGYDGLDVVARLVEVVSGEPYDRFVKSHIFDPLGMKDTTYSLTPEQEARLVGLYAAKDGKISASSPPLPPITHPSGGAGLYSTGPDYMRFAEMLAQGGKLGKVRILSRSSVSEISRTQLPAGFPDLQPGLAFGLGMRVVGDPVALKSPLPAGAYGWSGAWGTHFWVDPSRQLAAVWMINITTAGGAGSVDALDFEKLVMDSCAKDERCNRVLP